MKDRNLDQLLDAWMDLGPHVAPTRVAEAVRLEARSTRQRPAPLSRLARRIFPDMNGSIRFALAAAAVGTIALIGFGFLRGQNLGGPAPTPTSGPVSLVGTEGQVLEPGTYVVEAPFPVRLSFDLPADWATYAPIDEHLAAVCKESECELGLSFWVLDNLPIDGCELARGDLDPPVGPSIDDLATALVAQPGYRATGPTEASVSGIAGAYLELVGQGVPAGGCFERTTWEIGPHWRRSMHEEADQIWILDVDGTRLVIDAFATREASQADRAELKEMVDSIRIEAP